jgi:DNA replication protein DnaC
MSSPTSSSAESAPPRRAPQVDLATCPLCHGLGFVVPDLPFGDPGFGKAVPCQCRREERHARRLRSLQALSSLGTLARLTFGTFIPEPSHLARDRAINLRRAFETCIAYAQDPEGWLLLTGAYGCGKTHLAAAIANARLAEGDTAIFMTVPDLLDHLRAAFGPNSETSYDELFEQLRNTPLLVLDDLGAQSSTSWAQEKLFQLLNHRYNAQLPTVITTNQRLDELDPRLRSRLMDAVLVTNVAILAPDFRTGKNSGQSDLSTLNLHEGQRFDTFDAQRGDLSASERTNLRDTVTVCVEFARNPQGWLVLSGANGVGKTHLAAAIANEYVERTRTDVMFVVVPDLLDHLRAAFSPQATTSYDRRFDDVKRAPLLVLDDLGTESATPWAREKLFQLLNFRYNALLPTVITSSADPKQIEPWLRTRMLDVSRCRWLGITAPGYRGSRAQAGQGGRRSGKVSG